MKITRILKVSETEFYDHLEQELLSDIRQCAQKTYEKKDIRKGFKYSKYTQDVHAQVTITILEYKRGCLYQSKVQTLSDSITITYQTSQMPEGLQVILEEHIQSYESQPHSFLGRTFYELIYLRRMNETLYDLEHTITCRREGIPIRKRNSASGEPFLHKLLLKKKHNGDIL